MDDKRIHKTVALKHGNRHSVIGIKHFDTKTYRLIRRQYNQQAPTDKGVFTRAVERYNLAIYRWRLWWVCCG